MRLAPLAVGAVALLAACSGGVSRAGTPDPAPVATAAEAAGHELPGLPRADPVVAVAPAPTTTRPAASDPHAGQPEQDRDHRPAEARPAGEKAAKKPATGQKAAADEAVKKPAAEKSAPKKKAAKKKAAGDEAGKKAAKKKATGDEAGRKKAGNKAAEEKKAAGDEAGKKQAAGKKAAGDEAAKKKGGKKAAREKAAKQPAAGQEAAGHRGQAGNQRPPGAIRALAVGLRHVGSRVPGEAFATGRVLVPGDDGSDVAWIQRRLTELHFAPGVEDGRLGETTLAALWALQKSAGLEPRDVVDAEVWNLVRGGVEVQPLVGGEPNRAEVDLDRQLMTVWRDGRLVLVTHVSTGGSGYTTPTGDYRIRRRIDGWRHAPLGRLYNPLYFNGGIAIHGSGFVPTWPDSHGCVRVPMNVAEDVPHLLDDGAAVHVFRSSQLSAST